MRIEIRPSRRKLAENRPHTLDVVVTPRAPDVAPAGQRPPLVRRPAASSALCTRVHP